MLKRLAVHNFRSVGNIELLDISQTAVFFGPNGAGKSTILDAILLVRNCIAHGTTKAIDDEHLRHGSVKQFNGVLSSVGQWRLQILIGVDDFDYLLGFPNSPGGLVDPPSEHLSSHSSKNDDDFVLRGNAGDDIFETKQGGETIANAFAKPNHAFSKRTHLALTQVMGTSADNFPEWANLFFFVSGAYSIRSRYLDIRSIKCNFAERSDSQTLNEDASNLWSVLKNLHDCRDTDDPRWVPEARYETILKYLRRAFPEFRGWQFVNPSGTSQVYVAAGIHNAGNIYAQHLPDGLIQLTILLTAIFCRQGYATLLMFDEPDLSLHPWAQFVFAEAVDEAEKKWHRQVFIATHSPVLLSRFAEECLYVVHPKDGNSVIDRVSEMTENRDLLDQFAVGSLYMSQLIGEQSTEPMARVTTPSE